jgi:hypothetical protein
MYTKRNTIVAVVVGFTALLLIGAWRVSADDGGGNQWLPDFEPRLDGTWVMIAKAAPDIEVVHSGFNVAQDPQGLRYTTYVEHSQCSPSVWGTFPEANAHSQMFGLTEKTGPTTTKSTVIHYGLKTGGIQDEVVYIAITSWEGKIVNEDHSTSKATQSYYLPQQDADHDGLPDAGQKPALCFPFDATFTRVKLMPMGVPTPQP